MGLKPQCWPVKEKIFIFFCRGVYEIKKTRPQTPELYYRNHDQNHSYAFFHMEDDLRVFFMTIGRSRLHHFDWFQVDKMGKFVRNETPIYDYHTSFACVNKENRFLHRLLKECMDKEAMFNTSFDHYPEMMVLHFPQTRAPTYTASFGDSTLYFNWLICLLGLFLLFCCLK
ncbi:uncharacterized protein LOC108140520 [Drosophila elegans]|uniref:uncharacterized protein LOC108140520 n=1 Tax=Drosophila elegans TaxID=30023 RepID=UPI0007E61045|nr:uncharacterized protein LOC108140520 [Drosophila elegans]XP_041565344.1 uncharacterized protein LOC108140520 [Drosophila elegans]